MVDSACLDPDLIHAAEVTIDALRARHLRVVTAESCTGGLIAAVLCSAPHAGEALEGGFIVYSKAHKQRALGVPLALLERRGSVNASVAERMALGALERSDAHVAISVTGVLGPDADEDGNPAGLVYLAVVDRNGRPRVQEEDINRGGPDEVRRLIVLRALQLLQDSSLARH